MNKKTLVALALCLPFFAAQAQPSPAKKPLVARILKLQQPGIDAMATAMAERPALAVMDRAVKLAPTTIGSLLEEKFSEAELKQLADFLESPVYNKYQQLGGDMQKVLLEKLLADTKGTVEPKITALDQTVGRRLGVNAPAK